eukprot:1559453-Rhodomonas_salina.1
MMSERAASAISQPSGVTMNRTRTRNTGPGAASDHDELEGPDTRLLSPAWSGAPRDAACVYQLCRKRMDARRID